MGLPLTMPMTPMAANPKDRSRRTLESLGIPTFPKNGRIADVDGRQELGFHEGPLQARKRFELWESNYQFWDLSPGKPEPGMMLFFRITVVGNT